MFGFEANGLDKIFLDSTLFGGVGPTFDASDFLANVGGNAVSANNHILYDTKTGTLYYDVDGSSSAAKVAFAMIDTKLLIGTVDYSDFTYGIPPPGL